MDDLLETIGDSGISDFVVLSRVPGFPFGPVGIEWVML